MNTRASFRSIIVVPASSNSRRTQFRFAARQIAEAQTQTRSVHRLQSPILPCYRLAAREFARVLLTDTSQPGLAAHRRLLDPSRPFRSLNQRPPVTRLPPQSTGPLPQAVYETEKFHSLSKQRIQTIGSTAGVMTHEPFAGCDTENQQGHDHQGSVQYNLLGRFKKRQLSGDARTTLKTALR